MELDALSEQLREQEEDTLKLIADLQLQEKRKQDEVLSTAQEIQRCHIRVQKAKNAGREDLAVKAQERVRFFQIHPHILSVAFHLM